MPDVIATVRRGYLPESVALVLTGLVLGQFVPQARSLVSADVVLLLFVPGLVFEAAFHLEWTLVRRMLPALTGLALPGVVASAAIVAFALTAVAGLPLELAFVVGAIAAATDPVAVVATLARLRMPRRLRTLIEGESLLNDGTGLVLFAVAVDAVLRGVRAGDAIVLFVLTIVMSVAAGLGVGMGGAAVVRVARRGRVAFAVSILLAYGGYVVAAAVGLSGVLVAVVAGATLGNSMRRRWSDAVLVRRIERAWTLVAFTLSALTFLSIGLVIDVPSLADHAGAIAVGVLAVVAARAVLVYLPFVILRPSVPAGWAHVLFWSGLRGAIAFAAALALPPSLPQRAMIQDIAFGIVIVTLVVQGVTAPYVVRSALRRTADED